MSLSLFHPPGPPGRAGIPGAAWGFCRRKDGVAVAVPRTLRAALLLSELVLESCWDAVCNGIKGI